MTLCSLAAQANDVSQLPACPDTLGDVRQLERMRELHDGSSDGAGRGVAVNVGDESSVDLVDSRW